MAAGMAPNLRRAADVLRNSEALLILTGAGMGVDSGLGTFRGVNAGVWPPLKAMDIDFSWMSEPTWFDHDPRLAWAFWHFRHTAYVHGAPHDGYRILARWGGQMNRGFFTVTSNIDGHWARTEGVSPEQIYEAHGTLTWMQCVDEREGDLWPTPTAQIDGLEAPIWDVKPDEDVEIQVADQSYKLVRKHSWFGCAQPPPTGPWISAKVAADGSVVDGNGVRLEVGSLRRPGGVDLMRIREGCQLPLSPDNKPARPNVMMFNDGGVNYKRIGAQNDKYEEWKGNLPKDTKLMICEIGAGKAVPTIRRIAEENVATFPNSVLVRINLEAQDAEVPEKYSERSVSISGLGALAALAQIDAML